MTSKSKKNISKRNTGRTTIAEVAKQAKTSPISVSRAINNPDVVSKKLLARIEKAIEELGYIPNQAASSLASSESKIICVVFPSFSNAVFSDILDGINDVIAPAGYKIILGHSNYSEQEEVTLIKTMLEQNPAGMIITGIDQPENIKNILRKTKTPTIQIMELGNDPIDINVGISHEDAGYELTEHLYQNGYKNIAFIGARMDKRAQRRLRGYKKALTKFKMDPDKYVFTSLENTSFKLGGSMMAEFVNRHSEIDAIFFSNDDLAAGALFECQSSGIKVPEQLGIAGFNDLEFASETCPSITTVSVPRYEMGTEAAKSILNKFNNLETPNKIDLGFKIIPRDSTKNYL